jgi:hypothetical protein
VGPVPEIGLREVYRTPPLVSALGLTHSRKTADMNGECEAEAIRRGEAPKWSAVARSMNQIGAKFDGAVADLKVVLTYLRAIRTTASG